MKKITTINIKAFAMLFMISTATCFGITKTSSSKAGFIRSYDAKWQQSMNAQKNKFTEQFKGLFIYRKNAHWNKMRPELNMSKDEMSMLDCITIQSFEIDSAAFFKITPKTDLESILKLNKKVIGCYWLKNKDFLANGLFINRIKNGDWVWEDLGYGLIGKDYSETLYNTLFVKKQTIFHIYTMENSDISYRSDHYVYKEDGVLWIVSNGKIKLLNFLVEKVNNLKSKNPIIR